MRLTARALRVCLVGTGAALLIVTGAGCSSGDGTGTRAEGAAHRSAEPPAGGAPSAGADDPSASPTDEDATDRGVRYASCLRDNGIQVEDPTAETPVRIPSAVPPGELRRVEKACGKNPTGQALKGADLPDDTEADALRLKYKACMRENGYVFPEMGDDGVSISVEDQAEMLIVQKQCEAEYAALSERIDTLLKGGEK